MNLCNYVCMYECMCLFVCIYIYMFVFMYILCVCMYAPFGIPIRPGCVTPQESDDKWRWSNVV